MLGCYAQALSRDFEIDGHEIEAARWLSKDEARARLAHQIEDEMKLPATIAHRPSPDQGLGGALRHIFAERVGGGRRPLWYDWRCGKANSSSAWANMGLFRMALDIGVELGGIERAAQLIAFQLGHIDAIGGERPPTPCKAQPERFLTWNTKLVTTLP